MSDGPFTTRARLLIADDNDAMRYMFRMLAAAECEIVGEAETGQAALKAVTDLNPDVLLLDISMPGVGGFEVARILRHRTPELKIILASEHTQRVYVEEAFKIGVKGYVLKGAAVSDLPLAIREVLAGRAFRSPRIPL
jgi:DNA-binding NarL/FixJ family response regulator